MLELQKVYKTGVLLFVHLVEVPNLHGRSMSSTLGFLAEPVSKEHAVDFQSTVSDSDLFSSQQKVLIACKLEQVFEVLLELSAS